MPAVDHHMGSVTRRCFLTMDFTEGSCHDNFRLQVTTRAAHDYLDIRESAMATSERQNEFSARPQAVVITKDMLKNVVVIGQVDSKFIATSLRHRDRRYLILFDQHAVDERLKLEHLQKKYREDLVLLKRSKMENPLKISVRFDEGNNLKYLSSQESFEKCLKSSGIDCSVRPTPGGWSISVFDFPLALLQKITRKTTHDEFMNYIKDTVRKMALNHAKSDGRLSSDLFAFVFASEACARAVKFGDALNQQTMTAMIQQLGQCDLPFQCAHGRPTLAVINYHSA